MLNWMLWRSRLVPRLIAGWGMVSAATLGGLAIVVLFLEVSNSLAIALIAPLAVQEMVLALWFIFKGFDRTALDSLESHVAGGESASSKADDQVLVAGGASQG